MWDDDLYIRKLDNPLRLDKKMPLADWITYNKEFLLPLFEVYKARGGKMNYLTFAKSEYRNHYRNYFASFWYRDFDEIRRNIKRDQTLSFSDYLIKHRKKLEQMWEDHKAEKNRIVLPEIALDDKEKSFLEFARWVYDNVSDMITIDYIETQKQESIEDDEEIAQIDDFGGIYEQDKDLKPKSRIKKILLLFARCVEAIFWLIMILGAIGYVITFFLEHADIAVPWK